jgi:hypothetical protein
MAWRRWQEGSSQSSKRRERPYFAAGAAGASSGSTAKGSQWADGQHDKQKSSTSTRRTQQQADRECKVDPVLLDERLFRDGLGRQARRRIDRRRGAEDEPSRGGEEREGKGGMDVRRRERSKIGRAGFEAARRCAGRARAPVGASVSGAERTGLGGRQAPAGRRSRPSLSTPEQTRCWLGRRCPGGCRRAHSRRDRLRSARQARDGASGPPAGRLGAGTERRGGRDVSCCCCCREALTRTWRCTSCARRATGE